MVHRPFTLLLAVALAVGATSVARAQSLTDMARRADQQRKASAEPDRKYTANDLPGPARVDTVLGDFVMTETMFYRVRTAQLDIVKARRLDLALDRYLLKWEFATRGDPFGMVEPLQAEPKVLKLFDRENLEVRDYLFFQAALNRASADLRESKTARANLTKPRFANVEFVEHHENLLQPSWDLKVAEEDLERDRKYRMRE